MRTRLSLQDKLEKLLGSKNVYYQPPESVTMEYPAIRYSEAKIDIEYGDNLGYSKFKAYDIVVIDKLPDNPVIEKLLDEPYSSFDRHYVSDNMNHDIIRLYY